MRRAWCWGTVLAALTCGALHAAAPTGPGDRAWTLGDYQNAAQFYQEELRRAADSAQWGQTALKLGKLQLKLGHIAEAEKLLAEFRRRFPAQSPGTLPGDILLAQGKLAEAEKYFQALLSSDKTPAVQCETLFALGELALQQHRPEAEQYFRKISNGSEVSELWRTRALGGEIYAIINAGRFAEAAKLIQAESHRNPRYFQQLDLLWRSATQSPGTVLTHWRKMAESFPPAPEPLIAEALQRSARQAGEKQQFAIAAELLEAAYNYADTNLLRRQVLRDLIALQSRYDLPAAIKSCDRFLQLFPGAPDDFALRMLRGELFFRQKLYPAAQQAFTQLISEPGVAEADRVIAAQRAAVAAESCGHFADVKKLYEYALSHAPAERQSKIQFALMEFLLRRSEYPEIIQRCRELLKTTPGNRDRLNYFLLQALMAEKQLTPAEPVAAELAQSRDNNYAAFGAFLQAQIAEELHRLPEARELYRKFIQQHAGDPLVPEAQLAAAAIAAEQGENQLAAEEYSRFAEANPRHPKAAGALCLALRCMALQGDGVGVKQQHDELRKRFPASREYAIATLLRAEFLFERNRIQEAQAITQELLKNSAKNLTEICAGAQYLQARIAVKQGNPQAAITTLNSLLTNYPGATVAAEAALTAGNCAAQLHQYASAENFYRRAAELRPGGIFAAVAHGRVGDMLLAAYNDRGDRDKLPAAVELFQKLAESKQFPLLILQARYKMGVALEYSGQDQRALNCYEQLLYLAREQKLQGAPGAPEWCGRSVYAALRLCGNSNLPDAAQRARRILQLYADLELPGSADEVAQLKREIDRRYH